MRLTFMRYYQQCADCGEKVQWWEDKIFDGKDGSNTTYSHRRCNIVSQILKDEIDSLEQTISLLGSRLQQRDQFEKQRKEIQDLYVDLAALTAGDIRIAKQVAKNKAKKRKAR